MMRPTTWKITEMPPTTGIRKYSPTWRCTAFSRPWLATASPGAPYRRPSATWNGYGRADVPAPSVVMVEVSPGSRAETVASGYLAIGLDDAQGACRADLARPHGQGGGEPDLGGMALHIVERRPEADPHGDHHGGQRHARDGQGGGEPAGEGRTRPQDPRRPPGSSPGPP